MKIYIIRNSFKQSKALKFEDLEIETSKELIEIDLETLAMRNVIIYNVEKCMEFFTENDLKGLNSAYKNKQKYIVEEWN
ncbi:MAG: hypothetical protein R3Y05_01170 [bacterium]